MSGLSLFASLGAALHSRPLFCFKAVVLSTHTSAEAFVPELQRALLHGDTKWLDTYLDNSVKLLDTCNALREAIKEIKSYHGHVKLALNALDKAYIGEAQLRRARTALSQCENALKKKDGESNNVGAHRRSRLENCSSMLRRMGEKLNMEKASKGTFFKHRLREQMERQKAKGANALLQELSKTDIAVRSLKDQVEKLLEHKRFPLKAARISDLKKLAGSLKGCSIELNDGLDLLHRHVEDVFKILITSRMVLLEIYSSHHIISSFKLPHTVKDRDCQH